jgi:hypothetical protein
MMTPKEAWNAVGGLSKPSKIPCHGYSISAKRCITGAKLRNVKGSICSICYALKGRYVFSNVQNALERRFASMENLPSWIAAMTIVIGHYEKSGFFRWHDSGDLQSLEHLEAIVEIAKNLPNIKFWLPTREYAIIGAFYQKYGKFPENLTVRLSSYMIAGAAPILASRYGVQASGVHKDAFNCPAPKQGGKCQDCRACWQRDTFNVNYKPH